MKEWRKELAPPTAKASPAFRGDGDLKLSANLSFSHGMKKMEAEREENGWSGIPATRMEEVWEDGDCLFARLTPISPDKDEQSIGIVLKAENLPLV